MSFHLNYLLGLRKRTLTFTEGSRAPPSSPWNGETAGPLRQTGFWGPPLLNICPEHQNQSPTCGRSERPRATTQKRLRTGHDCCPFQKLPDSLATESEGFTGNLAPRPRCGLLDLCGQPFPVAWSPGRQASDNEEWTLPSSPLPLPVMIQSPCGPLSEYLNPG